MFHLGDDYLCPSKVLLPPGDNGENLEDVANKENEINDDIYRFRSLNGHQGPPKAPDPNLNKCKYNVLVARETGEKIYEPLSVLGTYAPVTHATYDGWKRYRNLAKRDKHDLSCIASPKGEMKSSFSWTSIFKSPTSNTLCFGEPTLGKLNQVKLLCSPTSSILCHSTLANLNQETEFCITKHIPLCDSVVHTGTTSSVPSSPSETDRNFRLPLQLSAHPTFENDPWQTED